MHQHEKDLSQIQDLDLSFLSSEILIWGGGLSLDKIN